MEKELLSFGQMSSKMVHRVLAIGEWVVDFLFARLDYDAEGVLACMYDIGASSDVLRAVVVIGPTSSGKQFVNTLVHEVHHLAVAIADSLGHDLESEVPAYLSGDAAMALAETVCEFGCSHCRD